MKSVKLLRCLCFLFSIQNGRNEVLLEIRTGTNGYPNKAGWHFERSMMPQKNPRIWGGLSAVALAKVGAPSAALGTITKITMAMEPKHDHRVERRKPSHQLNSICHRHQLA
jgi:hypothetical protein